MTDIRTVREIRIDEYKVTVAEHAGGFKASVTGSKYSGPLLAMSRAMTGSDWMDVDDAPIVRDMGEYVAAGRAVEMYLDDDYGEDWGDVTHMVLWDSDDGD